MFKQREKLKEFYSYYLGTRQVESTVSTALAFLLQLNRWKSGLSPEGDIPSGDSQCKRLYSVFLNICKHQEKTLKKILKKKNHL